MSSRSSNEVRADVEQARDRLASTVGQIGTVVDETKNDLIERGKQLAPAAAAAAVGLLALRLIRRR